MEYHYAHFIVGFLTVFLVCSHFQRKKDYIPVAQTFSLTNFMSLIACLGGENLYSGDKLGIRATNFRTGRVLR